MRVSERTGLASSEGWRAREEARLRLGCAEGGRLLGMGVAGGVTGTESVRGRTLGGAVDASGARPGAPA